MKREPASAVLSPTDARRAIYLDFEGAPNCAPVFSGWIVDDGDRAVERLTYHSGIHEPSVMELLADVGSLDGHLAGSSDCSWTLDEAIADLVETAEAEQRLIASWSHHDRSVVRDYVTDPDLVARFEARYRNGKKTAERWARATGRSSSIPPRARRVRHTLTAYTSLIEFNLPPDYGLKDTMNRFRVVEQYFNDTGDPDLSDAEARKAWRGFVRHNAYDCVALRHIVVTAASELKP